MGRNRKSSKARGATLEAVGERQTMKSRGGEATGKSEKEIKEKKRNWGRKGKENKSMAKENKPGCEKKR